MVYLDPTKTAFGALVSNAGLGKSSSENQQPAKPVSKQPASMSRTDLQKLHERICNQARELQVRKNHDYAKETDIFRNFRRYGTLGVLVRLSDKLARLDSFEENGNFAVADEKLEDTVMDIINYATIYLAMVQEKKSLLDEDGNLQSWAVSDGPYCDECERLAEFRHDAGTFWCAPCSLDRHYKLTELTPMEKL